MLILCTSKPHDGLLYYSYEYSELLNCPLVIVPHPDFIEQDYLDAIEYKYKTNTKNVFFNEILEGPTLIMGRSMMTLPFLNWIRYEEWDQMTLKVLFKNVIAVYSENHPKDYPRAKAFFDSNVVDIGDTEVYENFNGIHFEKRINFDIYQKVQERQEFKYLFMGTNEQYYDTVMEHIDQYEDHGIICYDEEYINPLCNNIVVPIDNLLGMFDKYVYTKDTFDPAPRIIQECKWLNKDIIYLRDPDMRDGGYVYYHRLLDKPDIRPIERALELI